MDGNGIFEDKVLVFFDALKSVILRYSIIMPGGGDLPIKHVSVHRKHIF